MSAILQCPVCRQPLLPSATGYRCAARHSFDAARQGYHNLQLAHKKHSKVPGDDPDMVQSRRRFLDLGYYQQVSDAINTAVSGVLAGRQLDNDTNLLDAGCGEGYYLQRLKTALEHENQNYPPITYHGVDVAKFAVRQATQRDRSMAWFVASINDLPFLAGSLDLLLSVFSPTNLPEFARILKPSGHLVTASPGPRHLNGLRQIIYPVSREHEESSLDAKAREFFHAATVARINYPIILKRPQEIMDLLAMTPYYWNITQSTKAKVADLDQLALDVDVEIRIFTKK